MEIKKDDKVKHQDFSDWGIGIVTDVKNNRLNVFFTNEGEKLLDSNYANLQIVKGEEAKHPLLDNLKPVRKKNKIIYRNIGQLITTFLNEHPKGFYDELYLKDERNYKFRAHERMLETLNEEAFSMLLNQNEFGEIVIRALRVVGSTNLIFPNEKMSLKDGLKTGENKEYYAKKLYYHLYSDDSLQDRFGALAKCLNDLDAANWTTQTYFWYITFPDQFMFMKPKRTIKTAEICAFNLKFDSKLNWDTYESLLIFSQYLKNELTNAGEHLLPRDMIDVQSFIWEVTELAKLF